MLHLLFIDLEKAFGSVGRKCIRNAVSKWKGIPKKLIAITGTIYDIMAQKVTYCIEIKSQWGLPKQL